ncbi:MAG: HupE/UreJ family protein [Alphaproteobacteria bacterium]|nr:HupE/UreJ family protein [Alphaproteobacteria bacterium]
MILRLLALPALLTPLAAHAHHMDGSRLPDTLLAGLLSGLGHPVIGLDHLAFVIGAGILGAAAGRGPSTVEGFVLGTLAGCLVHLAGVAVIGVETAVGLSLLALAVAIARGARGGIGMTLAFAAAGLAHGYAYGESIYGAEPTPVIAYLLGLTLIQSAIGIATWWLWSTATEQGFLRTPWRRGAAAVVGIAGLAALFA